MRSPGFVRRLEQSALAGLLERNSQRSARRNVARHYDFSERLYRSFLDSDLQYSCAYFARPGMTLDEAQLAKRRHVAAKLLLRPGLRVLDIGCGFGGLALHLARTAEVEVVGVTLSSEQLKVARRRAEEEGLEKRVRFELADYRALTGAFDRIVSVGMFEHVGKPQYPDFFAAVARLLDRRGVALLHSIGRMHGPGLTSAWIRRRIFPGGYIPALSEVAPFIERSGLWLTDLEVLRLHYAETLRCWRERFLADLYDDRFCRMWEFYLAASEMSFRYAGFMVFQAQMTHDVGAAPLTRDYMNAAER
jgi:cyclopropane-fatty-acyl-phospholipid synthase